MTMAYIIFVNPLILSVAMGREAIPSIVTATAISAGVSTLMMGIYAKKPFALASGMGLNTYFTYSVSWVRLFMAGCLGSCVCRGTNIHPLIFHEG